MTDSAHRYVEDLDRLIALGMEALGIPSEQIGASDHRHGIAWCAFNPFEKVGGSINPGGRINLDSGLLDDGLLTESYGEGTGRLWAKSRLGDRIDAPIAHEHSEGEAGTHENALKNAPDTNVADQPCGPRNIAGDGRGLGEVGCGYSLAT